ncbi:Sec-independent protein translocase protein TatB, partial [Nitrospirillum viridazoti]|uniref:Sec-independent protein translocase protein TatB n=1 Tax=Nitrospirillum viridazoti TaxID=3144925 RepID=UPI000C1C95A6
MFDIAWSELALIGVVALVVIGPKDLPVALYTAGKWMRKARLLARDFQSHLDDMVRQAELEDLRKQAQKVAQFDLTAEVTKMGGPHRQRAPGPGDQPHRVADGDRGDARADR